MSILTSRDTSAPSIFKPDALLREARRQKTLARAKVPSLCILDPDGDLVRRLKGRGLASPFPGWPCYHTDLFVFTLAGQRVGIIGRVVGGPFAVLVAEQLFASGCELLINLTSAGQIMPAGKTPYFVLIDRALRDEGTSFHYTPASDFADARPALVSAVEVALSQLPQRTLVGHSWTTDAPFRETSAAVEAARSRNILAVEMEAASLYAFAAATGVKVLCIAHVTNTMGLEGDDFEKGDADGTTDALAILGATVGALKSIILDHRND